MVCLAGLALTASAKAARLAERRLALTPVARGHVARPDPIQSPTPPPGFWLGAHYTGYWDRVALVFLFSQRFVTSGVLTGSIKD